MEIRSLPPGLKRGSARPTLRREAALCFFIVPCPPANVNPLGRRSTNPPLPSVRCGLNPKQERVPAARKERGGTVRGKQFADPDRSRFKSGRKRGRAARKARSRSPQGAGRHSPRETVCRSRPEQVQIRTEEGPRSPQGAFPKLGRNKAADPARCGPNPKQKRDKAR